MIRKSNGRVIPRKNYIYLGLVLIISFMILFYADMWYCSYRDSLLNVCVLNDHLDVINFNEIDDYIVENKDALVYVSVLGDEKINDFELKFINTIKDYGLRDLILYMDVSGYDQKVVARKFDSDYDYPYVVVYTNGNITDVYSISDNSYSSKKFIKYLNRIGVLESD